MTVATGLRSMMLTNVTRTARNRRTVTLQRSVEKMEDCINVVSGEIICTQEIKWANIFLGEIMHFAMNVDFAVLCLFVPTRMERISEILQKNLYREQKIRFLSLLLCGLSLLFQLGCGCCHRIYGRYENVQGPRLQMSETQARLTVLTVASL